MAKKRKEKVEESKANRIQPITPTVNATPELNAPEPLAKISPDKNAFPWEKRYATLPQGARERMRYLPLGEIESVTGEASVTTPTKEVATHRGVDTLQRITPVTGKAEVQNPTGVTNPAVEAAKPKTLSELLANQRKAAVKDKTDAAKMQKYYALTDAFNALGKMGGVAVGGAIGGNMLDSAPIVADYQPSRGYIDAFEKAKQADDRIRALDEKVFNLATRDEERAYNDKVRAAERKYQEEQNKLNREFQAEQNRLTREWNKAVADGNREAQARIEKDLAVLRHQNDMALQRLRNQGALAEKNAGQAYSQWQADMYNTTPIRFSDGSTIKIPDNYYEAIKRSLVNTKVNDKAITKDNVDSFIANNPDLINQYLADWGFVPNKQEEPAPAATAPAVQKTPYSGPSSRIDYANEQGPSAYNEKKEGSEEASMEEKKNKWRNRNSN